jgi:hypothetical protein
VLVELLCPEVYDSRLKRLCMESRADRHTNGLTDWPTDWHAYLQPACLPVYLMKWLTPRYWIFPAQSNGLTIHEITYSSETWGSSVPFLRLPNLGHTPKTTFTKINFSNISSEPSTEQVGSRDNPFDLYSEGARFESWLGHHYFDWNISWVSSVPPGTFQSSNWSWSDTTLPSTPIPVHCSLSTDHLTLQSPSYWHCH